MEFTLLAPCFTRGLLMRHWFWILLASLLLTGCATSTVEKRKQERYGAYSALSEEFRSAVDQTQIKVGMPMDAVYIAWGKPAQVVYQTSAQSTLVFWLYLSYQLHAVHYWNYYGYYGYCWGPPYLATGYYSSRHLSAEVAFENGLVKQWRTFPTPD
jgi:hypothetical protein